MTTIAGISFPTPFFNASGVHCSTKEELCDLLKSGIGGVWTKTTTFAPREGNRFPRVFTVGDPFMNAPLMSGNSVGLANIGIAETLKNIGDIESHHQPLVLSIGGADPHDIIRMVTLAKDTSGISAIEINTSCPNLEGKSMLAFNFDELEIMLIEVASTGVAVPIGLKLPYYQDISHFKRVVEIIRDTKVVKFITCINGMPGLVLDHNFTTRTAPNNGITGMGGNALLPFAMMNISTFYRLFREQSIQCDIIGCGGVTDAVDAYKMILAGAKGVQLGTRLLIEIQRNGTNGLRKLWANLGTGLQSLLKHPGGIEGVCGQYTITN